MSSSSSLAQIPVASAIPLVTGLLTKLVINVGVLAGFGLGPILGLTVAPNAASGALMLITLASGVAVLSVRTLD